MQPDLARSYEPGRRNVTRCCAVPHSAVAILRSFPLCRSATPGFWLNASPPIDWMAHGRRLNPRASPGASQATQRRSPDRILCLGYSRYAVACRRNDFAGVEDALVRRYSPGRSRRSAYDRSVSRAAARQRRGSHFQDGASSRLCKVSAFCLARIRAMLSRLNFRWHILHMKSQGFALRGFWLAGSVISWPCAQCVFFGLPVFLSVVMPSSLVRAAPAPARPELPVGWGKTIWLRRPAPAARLGVYRSTSTPSALSSSTSCVILVRSHSLIFFRSADNVTSASDGITIVMITSSHRPSASREDLAETKSFDSPITR